MNPGDIHNVVITAIYAAVPLSAIIGGICFAMIKRFTAHAQEMAKIKYGANRTNGEVNQASVELLRDEMIKLRDTTTQYDMSVERTLSEIKNRLAHVESQVGIQSVQSAKTEPDPPQDVQRQYVPITSTESNSELQQVTLGRTE